MKTKLDENGLDLKPHNLAPDCWYYEEKNGLYVYWLPPGKTAQLICVIPWRSLRASLKRKDAKRKAK